MLNSVRNLAPPRNCKSLPPPSLISVRFLPFSLPCTFVQVAKSMGRYLLLNLLLESQATERPPA